MKRIRGYCNNCAAPRYGARKTENPLCRKCDIERRNVERQHPNSHIAKREARMKKKYGLEYGEYEKLWEESRGLCKLCGISLTRPERSKGQVLSAACVDHCHTSGKIRGLICNGCNKGLGLFKDNIDLLQKAINYLKENNA